MSELSSGGESFPKPPNKTLQEDQLFPAEILAQNEAGVVHAISADDKTLVTIDKFAPSGASHYDAVGDDIEGVREARDRLDEIFEIDVNYGWLREKTMVQQLGRGSLEKVIKLAGEVHSLEQMIGSSGVRSLEGRTADLREEAIKRREETYSQMIADLNERIEDDPSDIMLGLALGSNPMAAKLEGLYVGEVEVEYLRQRIILPVLSGQNGELGRLSTAKNRELGIYGVFAEATEIGLEQVEETEHRRKEFVRRWAK